MLGTSRISFVVISVSLAKPNEEWDRSDGHVAFRGRSSLA